MIATTSNNTTFEPQAMNGFQPLLRPNYIQNPKTFNQKAVNQFVEVEFADFDYKFKLKIVSQSTKSNKIKQKLELARGVFLHLELTGERTQKPEIRFNISSIDLSLELADHRPISCFIASSFQAMRGLSRIIFSRFEDRFSGSFLQNLKDVSYHLQNRQFVYRLMVIEKALKISILIPNREINNEEIKFVRYCYHLIINRKFEFETDSKYNVGETETEHFVGELFGNRIDLGIRKVSIVKRGVCESESITVPTLPKNAFSKDIQKLIDLDEKLDSMVMDKYLNSFSNAFEGLTDEQIEAITERPKLEEEAFNF